MDLKASQDTSNIYPLMNMPKDKILSKKTFIISHIIILLSALFFFGGLYYILYQDKFQSLPINYNPVTREPVSLFLDIANPEDEILVYDSNLIVSGKTGPNFSVIISGINTDSGLQSGKDGEFSKVLSLDPGANIILVTAFDPEGNSKSIARSVY